MLCMNPGKSIVESERDLHPCKYIGSNTSVYINVNDNKAKRGTLKIFPREIPVIHTAHNIGNDMMYHEENIDLFLGSPYCAMLFRLRDVQLRTNNTMIDRKPNIAHCPNSD